MCKNVKDYNDFNKEHFSILYFDVTYPVILLMQIYNKYYKLRDFSGTVAGVLSSLLFPNNIDLISVI